MARLHRAFRAMYGQLSQKRHPAVGEIRKSVADDLRTQRRIHGRKKVAAGVRKAASIRVTTGL